MHEEPHEVYSWEYVSKREEFAKAILQGLIARLSNYSIISHEVAIADAVELADLLIIELNKKRKE